MISQEAANKITRERIATLKPDFAQRVKFWLIECQHAGINVYVYCGRRTAREQEELYEQGRSKPGRIVTRARAGQSFHNYGRAIDWVPLVPAPKGGGLLEAGWDRTLIYARAQKLAEKFQLRALSWETPHLEDGQFKNWQELAKKEPIVVQ